VWAVTTFSLVVIIAVSEEHAALHFQWIRPQRWYLLTESRSQTETSMSAASNIVIVGTCYPVMKKDPLILLKFSAWWFLYVPTGLG
jgi:hypothetical protein